MNVKENHKVFKYIDRQIIDGYCRIFVNTNNNFDTEELCKECDVSRSTLYAHFANPNKILDRVYEDLIDDCINSILSPINILNRLKGLTKSFDLNKNDPLYYRFICAIKSPKYYEYLIDISKYELKMLLNLFNKEKID